MFNVFSFKCAPVCVCNGEITEKERYAEMNERNDIALVKAENQKRPKNLFVAGRNE